MRVLQLQPQRAIGLLAVVVALVLSSMVAYDVRRDYEQQFAITTAKTHSLTQLLEEHAIQSMRRVELALSLAAQELDSAVASGEKISPAVGTALRSYLLQDGLIASFAVLDAKGQTIASTLTEDPADLPQAMDRDFFQAHQSPAFSGLFIGAAVKSRISGRWIVPVSIRLQGEFQGYLMGAVDPEYFQRLYRSIDTGSMGFVSLFTSQGWAIARWPFQSEMAERNWMDAPLFKDHISRGQGNGEGQLLVQDGAESVVSYRTLREYPLTVVLGVSVDESLAPWRQRMLYECAGLLLVLLFLGGATVLVQAQLRRRQLAESALKLSEISVLKSSLPTLWIGSDARILRVNQAACDLHGYTEEQMLGMTVIDLNPRMTAAKWPEHWARLRQAKNMRFEAMHRTGQGQDVPVEAELNFIEFEGQEYNFAFIRDLTLRKQADAELQRSAAMLRGAMDAVDEAFVLFDADDTLVYCNERYVQLYPNMSDVVVPGAKFENMIRVGTQRGLYQESVGREEEWIAERMRAHRQGQETRIQRRNNGRVFRVIDRCTPDGNIVGLRVDITEMVRATEEAQEASRYKSQFLANMSHEIRTPMNAILGLLTLLQKTELNGVQRDYANKTHGAAQSLLGLLNDILDFSKVEAGKLELDPQPLRLDRMLSDIAVILSPNIGTKCIDVMFDVAAQVPSEVLADAMRLQQVLVNLLGNAIKFTSEGQVVLQISSVAPPEGDVFGDRWLQFAVSDSGIGIAEDKQAHIFSGFSQAEASTTRRFGGTGLGLAISKRLVELMGGTLELHSVPGQGSTFSFSLPLLRVGDAPDLGLANLPPQAPRVLVVDDNPVARGILCNMVQSWGWPVQGVESGAQALAQLQSEVESAAPQRDVVYLDWQMPGMDGWEAAKQLDALYAGQPHKPRIVMLSANSRDSLNVRTAQEQALVAELLTKPATPNGLQDAALGRLSPDARSRLARRSSSRPLAGLRVLVVEDNLINQQVAEELLNAEGALVSLAANGQLGVDAVQASHPPFDVVLMDIQMPVLDGYGATRKIREELGMVALPIVAMTANAMASDRTACLAAGMNEHVGKPFDTRHLVTVLLEVTGRAPLAAEGSSDFGALQEAPPPAMEDLPMPQERNGLSPYLDVDAALERISGMTDLYVNITQDYVQTLDLIDSEFRALAAKGDMPALAAYMHTLKGTSATLGAVPLSEQAARLEKLFRKPEADTVPLDHLGALLELVHHTKAAAVRAIDTLSSPSQELEQLAPHAVSPEQRRAALAFLKDLAALLAHSDLTALEMFAQRGNALDALDAPSVAALAQALDSLDLAAAHTLCQSQMDTLVEALS